MVNEKMHGLSGNTLKIIAALSMVIDHIGVMLLPQVILLRVIGRISFPIFAFMIAEGCEKTSNRRRYFLSVFLLGVACQLVYFLYDGVAYMGILITFSLAILLNYGLQAMKKALFDGTMCRRSRCIAVVSFLFLVAAVYALNRYISIDYGFWGCMLPVFASVFRTPSPESAPRFKRLDRLGIHVAMLGLGLVILSHAQGGVQIYSLFAIPLLLLYSGSRGTWNMKSFFYIFYPTHLATLALIVELSV